MKPCLYLLAAMLFFNSTRAQSPLIIGQRQGMMFTDIAPDIAYTCSWPLGARTCNQYFPFDVNHDGIKDFDVVHANVECWPYSYRYWRVQASTNVEFVADSLGITRFDAGDSIGAGSNYKPDTIITYTGTDSLGNPHYDTTHFVRNGKWTDTLSWSSGLIA